jgi:RHS repeat-associated protein
VTFYLLDANNPTGYAQVLEEHVDGDLDRSYTIGHDVIAQADSLMNFVVTYLLGDGHGSTRQVMLYEPTVPLLLVLQAYDYDAYGNMTVRGSDPNATPLTSLLYSGEMTDASTGLQYLRARYYDPSTGRFNRLDPYAGNTSDPLSLHKYTYCHSSPIMATDPSGMMSISELCVSIGISTALAGIGTYSAGKLFHSTVTQDIGFFMFVGGVGLVSGGAFGMAMVSGSAQGIFLSAFLMAMDGVMLYTKYGLQPDAAVINDSYLIKVLHSNLSDGQSNLASSGMLVFSNENTVRISDSSDWNGIMNHASLRPVLSPGNIVVSYKMVNSNDAGQVTFKINRMTVNQGGQIGSSVYAEQEITISDPLGTFRRNSQSVAWYDFRM